MSAVPASAAATVPGKRRRPRRGMVLALVLVALLAVAGTYAALALTRDEAPTLPPAGEPAVLTSETLAAVTAATHHEVYGIATPAGATPEVTRAASGEVWVRYLIGPGARVGDPRADYLTIGTYPRADALAAAKAAAHGKQTRSVELPDGGVMLWSLDRPESVYAASPGRDLLVEVYSPDPARARALVEGGLVAPLR